MHRAEADFCARQREAFLHFGLDPLAAPTEKVARTVTDSRLRDPLLGLLLEWQLHGDAATKRLLGQVVGAARRRAGGAYARWQDLLDRKDVAGLVAFSISPDGLNLPERLVGALGRDLSDARQLRACLAYLRAGTDRYPHDAWLHFDLFGVCRDISPPEPQEALRHMAAACVLKPESALFHLQLGACYSTLKSYDRAVQAFRKSIALYPSSAIAYRWMGLALAKNKDEAGATAAFEEALRLSPNDPGVLHSVTLGLITLGRPAEAMRTILDAFGRFPSWAEDPRLYLRYNAACAALICADRKRSPSASESERQTFRKQAFDLLAAELAGLTKLAASDRDFAHRTAGQWLADGDLEGVRPPRTAELVPDERRGWEEFWKGVKSLGDSTEASPHSESP